VTYAPTSIDLSRATAPDAIEVIAVEQLLADFLARFNAGWAAERQNNSSLPAYEVTGLETDSVVIVGEAWTFLRYLDRVRVNDAIRAMLAPLARGSDLDSVVARAGVFRLLVAPANPATNTPAVYESDAQLLRRYLLSFDVPSAGSAGRFLYEAYSAWPGMLDARVNGRAVHGRRGDTDVVIAGPGGRDATDAELATVRAAVTASHVAPEAISVSVLRARRSVYDVDLTVDVPSGPDANVVGQEVARRVRAATDERTLIGGEAPLDRITGAAYGDNVIRVRRTLPLAPVLADPYVVPVCENLTVRLSVQA